METQIRNYPGWKPFAPESGHEVGTAEAKLWYAVLNRNMMKGYQFYRQYPVCQYIVDFISPKLSLIIEIAGSVQTPMLKSANKKRDDLMMLGYQVLSFSVTEVEFHLDEVIEKISHEVDSLENKMVAN